MRHYTISLTSPLAPAEAWARVLDLRVHDRVIPFTRITSGLASADELRPGHEFTACTMVGRVGFDDVMRVESLTPPSGATAGHARIVKTGRLVLGAVELTVSAHDGGSTVRWEQDFGLGRLVRPARWAAELAAPLLYGTTLRRLLRG
ncbi:hypothetical protein GCM10012320_20780 [Sinomonas cellulolyticus]|uniref:Uncharacterized protein n=1 Tax=Sinomonas cellulolyticus TaxID=2801916 RepID=A0ABS1K2A4_9MICC|nr:MULTISPECIES: hypothetical protein [Sinomonas]MBL0705588.1 hypothetical protein [Sinomonas cellulolyticus]GHG51471.1 hypothetical protein GCM10012320_20780 [Sinomonas sp. KCTC 49339]